jgi:hypothetical protein
VNGFVAEYDMEYQLESMILDKISTNVNGSFKILFSIDGPKN